jgi:hypothetical protein
VTDIVRARMEFGLNQSGGIRIRPANLTAIPADPFRQQVPKPTGQLDLFDLLDDGP